jgi:outer membrane protein OmpA-like peptidoglycan-associated protein
MRATPRTRDFDDDAVWTGSKQRNWLAVGLLVSLLLHAALCGYFYKTRFDLADSALKMPEPTATFKVKNVDLSALEKASQDQTTQAAKPEPDKTDVQLPDEKKSFDKLLEEVHASTAMPDDTSDVLPDKPRVDQSNASSIMNEIERSTAQVLSNSPNATREQSLLNDSATSGRPQPALTGTELATSTTIKRPNVINKIPGDSAGPDRGRAPGFSDLDSLLSQRGPLGAGTAIRLPSDPLYEYDSADLSRAPRRSCKTRDDHQAKPEREIHDRGYSDTFGTAEYNYQLSQRRADSVAEYLVTVLGVNPAQVQARGFGPTKLLVTPRAIDPRILRRLMRRSHGNARIAASSWLLIPAASHHQFLIHLDWSPA